MLFRSDATFVASLVTPANHGKLSVASLFGPGKDQIDLAQLAFSPAPQSSNGDVYVLIDPMAGVPTTGNSSTSPRAPPSRSATKPPRSVTSTAQTTTPSP